jgi:hypothetical protein
MYKAVLFSTDGEDWVTDYRESQTIEEVEELLANQGSRWFFYPWHFVIVDHGGLTTDTQRVVSAAWPFEYLKGRMIKTVGRELQEVGEEVYLAII